VTRALYTLPVWSVMAAWQPDSKSRYDSDFEVNRRLPSLYIFSVSTFIISSSWCNGYPIRCTFRFTSLCPRLLYLLMCADPEIGGEARSLRAIIFAHGISMVFSRFPSPSTSLFQRYADFRTELLYVKLQEIPQHQVARIANAVSYRKVWDYKLFDSDSATGPFC
jgi:hypothetical protein